MTHKQLSKEIRTGLGQANKSLNTAERFGNRKFYNQGEAKLRHAKADINSIGSYRIKRTTALRHAIGFEGRKAHPAGCNCPYHGGHKRGKKAPAMKGIGRSPGFSLRGSAVGGMPRRL